MGKIFVFCVPTGRSSYGMIKGAEPTGDVIGYALAEDGVGIASHYSSGENWSKHDMGITSDWKHAYYEKHYPNGYELEWIDFKDLDNHEGYLKAMELNAQQKSESEKGDA